MLRSTLSVSLRYSGRGISNARERSLGKLLESLGLGFPICQTNGFLQREAVIVDVLKVGKDIDDQSPTPIFKQRRKFEIPWRDLLVLMFPTTLICQVLYQLRTSNLRTCSDSLSCPIPLRVRCVGNWAAPCPLLEQTQVSRSRVLPQFRSRQLPAAGVLLAGGCRR